MLEKLSRVEKLTRAVLSSDDGGVPLSRFSSDYQRMTKTQFPWREYGFASARDMLLSMESVVEFKFSDEEGQFYLVPAYEINGDGGSTSKTSNIPRTQDNENKEMSSTRFAERFRTLHTSNNSSHISDDTTTSDGSMPTLFEAQSNDEFTVDHLGRVSVYVSQSKEKPIVNGYWNVCCMYVCVYTCM